ncbi:hypothetical protein EJB05_21255, partial [Eragrostis curvula]
MAGAGDFAHSARSPPPLPLAGRSSRSHEGGLGRAGTVTQIQSPLLRPSMVAVAVANKLRHRNVWQQGNKTTQVPVRVVARPYSYSQIPSKSIFDLARNEFRCLKRKDLIETLAKKIPAGSIRFGCHIVAIHEDPDTHGAVLTSVDGSTIRAKVLIGCDGTNSVVAKYLGLSVPKTFPITVLRGFTRYQHGHPFETEFLRLREDDFFLGRMPITDNMVHFFVGMLNASQGSTTDYESAVKDLALQKLKELPTEVADMIRDSEPGSLNVVTKLWYRPLCQVAFGAFQKGAVTVAGDAMHAIGPFIGQGGAAGLEDAVVFARALSRADAEYITERRLRVTRLSLESFAVGVLMHTKLSVAKLACKAILALLGTHSLGHTNYDCGRL